MAITLTQSNGIGGAIFNDGAETLSFPAPVTAGTLMVFAVRGPGSVTITDDIGTATWTLIRAGTVTVHCVIHAAIASGGEQAITCTLDGGPNAFGGNILAIYEFAGNSTNLTAVPGNDALGTAVTSFPAGSATPDATDNVFVGVIGGGTDTWASPGGWTDVFNNTRGLSSYLIQSAATAQDYTPTSVGSETARSLAVAFRGAAAGGGNPWYAYAQM